MAKKKKKKKKKRAAKKSSANKKAKKPEAQEVTAEIASIRVKAAPVSAQMTQPECESECSWRTRENLVDLDRILRADPSEVEVATLIGLLQEADEWFPRLGAWNETASEVNRIVKATPKTGEAEAKREFSALANRVYTAGLDLRREKLDKVPEIVKLSVRDIGFLQALVDLGAKSWPERVNADQIAKEIHSSLGSDNVKRSQAKLGMLKFVMTEGGPAGGCLITSEGLNALTTYLMAYRSP